jgi:hypothetical protein
LSGSTPCQKENQHQCHKRFQLKNFPTPTTIVRCAKVMKCANTKALTLPAV